MVVKGIRNITGEKNGRSYSFDVIYVEDRRPLAGLKGLACYPLTVRGFDASQLEIGKDYTFFTYRDSNGRTICNGFK